jgi:hypothetical protein
MKKHTRKFRRRTKRTHRKTKRTHNRRNNYKKQSTKRFRKKITGRRLAGGQWYANEPPPVEPPPIDWTNHTALFNSPECGQWIQNAGGECSEWLEATCPRACEAAAAQREQWQRQEAARQEAAMAGPADAEYDGIWAEADAADAARQVREEAQQAALEDDRRRRERQGHAAAAAALEDPGMTELLRQRDEAVRLASFGFASAMDAQTHPEIAAPFAAASSGVDSMDIGQ